MAGEEAYEGAIRVLAESAAVDALLVGCVPLTSALKVQGRELADPGSLAARLPRLFRECGKPLVVVVDSGARYEPLVHALREGGVPVLRSADQAVRSLGRYLCHRAARAASSAAR
jgi:acyl-CoA synthetase (NDP forming)